MKKIFNIILGCTLLGGLSLAACSSSSKANEVNSADSETETVAANSAGYVFSVIDENKKELTLRDLKGKVVFINFWATWCPPCIQEMPSIAALKKKFPDNPNLVFLMVDVDNNLSKSVKFMKKNKYDLPVVAPNSAIPAEFLGNSIPTTVILDKDGEIAIRIEGGRNYDTADVHEAITDLLK